MTDEELLAKIRNPDTANYGFNLLVREYQQRVYRLARKMVIDHDDADDITQEVFIKVHRSLPTFRADSQLFTWIYRIATNECITFLNKKRRRFFLPIHDVGKELSARIESGRHISGDEIQRMLQKALTQLPDKQRLVFTMKYFEELSYEQMETVTGTSIGALKASYHHAVKKIEEFLKA